jgi:transcriptional regulator with XRE-family HTH domain
MRYGEVLRKLREAAGLTQEQLADKAGVPIGSIRNYEQGQRLPGLVAGIRLAKVIGVSVDAFADCDEVKEAEKTARKPKK